MNFESDTIIPIFHARLILSVTKNVIDARIAKNNLFGIYLNGGGAFKNDDVKALASSEGHNFALFFHHDQISHEVLAHEIFHVTCRILNRVECKFDINNHEQYAYLCGWITEWVYEMLKIHEIEVN